MARLVAGAAATGAGVEHLMPLDWLPDGAVLTNNRGVHEYRWMLEKGVYDILQPDIMVADGVTGFREISTLAQTFRKPVVPHHGGGNLGTIAQLHCIASWPHAPWIEMLHDPPVAAYTNGFSILENPPLVDKEGYLNLPEGPGLGVTIRKDLAG